MGFSTVVTMRVFCLFLVILGVYSVVEAGPAYGQTNYNNWEAQQQQPARRNTNQAQGGKRTLQGMVRQHIDDLDKQTQSDLKVLNYLEKELNQIFSCYIKLSCPRMRSAKVLAECDEIKDWPLYHQVMKMAGIRKYPYQSYAPTQTRRPLATASETETSQSTDLHQGRNVRQEREMNNNDAIDNNEDTGVTDDEIENDQYYQAATRRRQQGQRRVRREFEQHHH